MVYVFRLLFLGIGFGFVGFLIETVSNYVNRRRFVYAGDKYFWGIPVLPIYSVGGLITHSMLIISSLFPWFMAIGLAWLSVCFWEYFAGWYCDRVMKKKFWDYSKEKYNLKGYVSLKSAGWWLVFISIYYFFLFQEVQNVMKG